MKLRDFFLLLLLATIWGGSFLFLRLSVHDFGPLPLILVRVGVAAGCLIPLVTSRSTWAAIFRHPRELFIIGLLNSALPFTLLAYATMHLTAGFTALLNATTPLMAALVGAVCWRRPLRREQWVGLVIGLVGVLFLSWNKLSFRVDGSGWAVLAAVAATWSYGLAANYSKSRLTTLPPVGMSAGSLFAATVLLLPLGWWQWPDGALSAGDWWSAIALAVLCTAVAYVVYFQLIINAGPTQAASVTFLVPVFALLWGALLLHEPVTLRMVIAMGIILVGTSLTNGWINLKRLWASLFPLSKPKTPRLPI